MKVLVACEESQTVCKAFRERGHEAYSCDIQEPSGGRPEWHILGDVLNVLNGGGFNTMDWTAHYVDKWDLIIAHPPCTYLSNAGACRLYPKKNELNYERYSKGLEGKTFFLHIYYANCDKICIENPTPSSVYKLPKCSQVIQPYEYGHPFSKRTCLWLKGLPDLKPTEIIKNYKPYLPSGTSRKIKEQYGADECEKGGNRQKKRSKTFEGIAKAMADQWGGGMSNECYRTADCNRRGSENIRF